MKVLRIIILLMILINCYDPEMTKKQCKEQLKSDITNFLVLRGDYESYKKRRKSQGETEEEIQKSWNDGIIYIILLFLGKYLGCMGQTVNCGTPVDFILHLPDCVEEIK